MKIDSNFYVIDGLFKCTTLKNDVMLVYFSKSSMWMTAHSLITTSFLMDPQVSSILVCVLCIKRLQYFWLIAQTWLLNLAACPWNLQSIIILSRCNDMPGNLGSVCIQHSISPLFLLSFLWCYLEKYTKWTQAAPVVYLFYSNWYILNMSIEDWGIEGDHKEQILESTWENRAKGRGRRGRGQKSPQTNSVDSLSLTFPNREKSRICWLCQP